MNQINKDNQFIDWITGKSNYFPFFKMEEMPEIPMPINFPEKYQHLSLDDDIYSEELEGEMVVSSSKIDEINGKGEPFK